jgi:hypothetical protein
MPTGDRLHHLNIFLMLFSMGLAFLWPFETVLLAYAVLGPLHYLTEISWLHDRQYFLPNPAARNWLWGGLALLILCFGFFPLSFLSQTVPFRGLLLFWVFAGFGVFILTKDLSKRLMMGGVLACLGLALHGQIFEAVFAGYLVTFIHVFVFTGLFMWNGVKTNPSKPGWMAMGLFVGLPLTSLALPAAWSMGVTHWGQAIYSVLFAGLNRLTLELGGVSISSQAVFETPLSVVMTRLLAFAYLYHYLNWFSKPGVIRWHHISRRRWIAIVTVWLGAVGVYAWNYATGLMMMGVLSFSHVVLEFPLNHLSFRQLFQGKAKTGQAKPGET